MHLHAEYQGNAQVTDIVTQVSAETRMMPFQTLPGPELWGSGIPRAVAFVNQDWNSAGTGAGDTEQLEITVTLPRGYVYRPLDLKVTCGPGATADIADWTAAFRVAFGASEYEPNGRTQKIFEGTSWRDAAGANYWKQWYIDGGVVSYFQMIDAREPEGGTIVLTTFNNSAGTAALPWLLSGRWLQYDISEGFAWPIWSIGNALAT